MITGNEGKVYFSGSIHQIWGEMSALMHGFAEVTLKHEPRQPGEILESAHLMVDEAFFNEKHPYRAADEDESAMYRSMQETTEKTLKDLGKKAFDFGEAIKRLKDGQRVYRKGWNGKSQYIELASCISYKSPEGETVNAEHDAIGNKAIAFVGTSGVQMGWLASQADMLAEDWMVL